MGHKGKTLIQSNTPDEHIDITYEFLSCVKCNNDLTTTIAKLKEKRQVLDLDISAIQTKITQKSNKEDKVS